MKICWSRVYINLMLEKNTFTAKPRHDDCLAGSKTSRKSQAFPLDATRC